MNQRCAGSSGGLKKGVKTMNKLLKKIDAAMNEYYVVNGIEFNPYDDEMEEKAIVYAAEKLGLTVAQVTAELE